MPKLIMLKGPSGSGKSHKARELMEADANAIRLNRDLIREMSILKWTPRREGWIIDAEMGMADAAAKTKRNIIVDDTNLTILHAEKWERKAKELGYEFSTIAMNTSLQDCINNDDKRTGKSHVGRIVIERQFLKNSLVQWPTDKQIVIFDMDGTLADLQHRIPWITIGADCPTCEGQGTIIVAGESFDSLADVSCEDCKEGKIIKKNYDMFYHYTNVMDDPPIDVVVKWARECAKHFCILIVSGRSPESAGQATIDWLVENDVHFDHIYMRRPGIHGHDHLEKQLILDDILKTLPKDRIAFVVDDRPSVIKMWRRNGLSCIPVRGREDDAFYKFDPEDTKSTEEVNEKDIVSTSS